MKHLYPAQKLNLFLFIKYSAVTIRCLLSFHFSFSQTTNLTNASVDLVSFTAQSNGSDKINAEHCNRFEMNLSHFVIQRSTDGVNFEDVAVIFSEEDNTNSIQDIISILEHQMKRTLQHITA